MDKRKICVVTGTRAEYGLLYWTMKRIQEDPALELQVVATGMHLSPEFGSTYQQIVRDGFEINEKVEMLLSSDTSVGITKSVGLALIGFADTFARLKPDIVVVLGDRYEMLAAAQSALFGGYPIAHIHGGEITLGAIDDQIRHAITKMASLHFVAANEFRKRVIQLGEHPERVQYVGALGIEYIKKMEFFTKEEIENKLKFTLKSPTFLVTLHPTTNPQDKNENDINILLSALEKTEARIIFTKANSDEMGMVFNKRIEEFVKLHRDRMSLFDSLGQKLYLSTMKFTDLLIGNSSSGIIEAPFMKKPVLNIGSRQEGRLRSPLVVDCRMDETEIGEKIKYILNNPLPENTPEVYGVGNSSEEIVSTLKNIQLSSLKRKEFYDLIHEDSCQKDGYK